jgi:hypothetical protein
MILWRDGVLCSLASSLLSSLKSAAQLEPGNESHNALGHIFAEVGPYLVLASSVFPGAR